MIIAYNEATQRFEAKTDFAERYACNAALKAAGFSFDYDGTKVWHSQSYAPKYGQKPRTWSEQVAVAVRLSNYLDSAAQARIASDATATQVAAQVKDQEALKAESLETSRATDADIDLPLPEGLSYLPYQRAGIAYAMKRQNTLIADEMGLGKTIQAIGVNNTDIAARKILIIAPAKIKLNWAKEFVKWDTKGLSVGIITNNSKKTREAIERWGKGLVSILPKAGPFTTDVVIANYDILAKGIADMFREITWDILISDECHKIKNGKAQRTQHLLGRKEKRDRKTGEVIPAIAPIAAKRNVFLTGTPIVNRPLELWPLLERFDPNGLGKNFFKYAQRYCGAFHNGHGWDFSGSSNLDELQNKLRSMFMVRRLKSEVLKDLPPKRRSVVVLEAPDSLEEILKREQVAFAALKHDNTLTFESIDFTAMSKVRKEVADAKAPFVIEYVEDALESLDKVVVFAHHDSVIRKIAEHFGNAAVFANGTCSDIQVQEAAERFQTDPTCKVFVGSIIAAGVGITLTAASTVIFAELDWVPGNVTQAEDRCHRIGQTDSVNIYHLVLDGSVDARMVELLIEKQEVIDSALDTKHAAKPMPIIGRHFDAVVYDDMVKKPKPEVDTLPVEVVRAIHQGLQQLAGVCDGAQARDGMGFNGADTVFGKSLAGAQILTPKQARAGQRLIRKYQKQLDPALVAAAGITSMEHP